MNKWRDTLDDPPTTKDYFAQDKAAVELKEGKEILVGELDFEFYYGDEREKETGCEYLVMVRFEDGSERQLDEFDEWRIKST